MFRVYRQGDSVGKFRLGVTGVMSALKTKQSKTYNLKSLRGPFGTSPLLIHRGWTYVEFRV